MVITDFTFHDRTTIISDGLEYINHNIGFSTTLDLDIYGTATTSAVIFEAMGLNGRYRPIQGFNSETTDLSSTTLSNDSSWQFDLTGKSKFRVRITVISDGFLTIKGKVIS